VFHAHIARNAETLATNMMAYLDGLSLHHQITENYIKIPEQLTQWVNLMADFLLITPNEYDVDELITQPVGR